MPRACVRDWIILCVCITNLLHSNILRKFSWDDFHRTIFSALEHDFINTLRDFFYSTGIITSFRRRKNGMNGPLYVALIGSPLVFTPSRFKASLSLRALRMKF